MRAHACTHVLEGARTPANIPRPVYTRVHTCAPRCTHADGEEDEGGREKGTRGEREERGWDEGSGREGRTCMAAYAHVCTHISTYVSI